MFRTDRASKDALVNVARNLGGWLDTPMADKLARAAGASPAHSLLTMSESLPEGDAPPPAKPSYELGESFALWTLGFKAIQKGLWTGEDLGRLATSSGRWHHQVKVNKNPVGFARTTPPDGEAAATVLQLYVTDIAKAIDGAIKWLDRFEEANPDYVRQSPTVRLLHVPPYYLYAFWLVKSDNQPSDVLVIDAPTILKELPFDKLIDSKEFLNAFRNAPAPVSGLP
jgi:hypothetical protein